MDLQQKRAMEDGAQTRDKQSDRDTMVEDRALIRAE
jgi:hypothetical protein